MTVVRKLRFRNVPETLVEREGMDAFRHAYSDVKLGPIVVVIPAFNEAESIGVVLDELPDVVFDLHVDVLVMSDGSTDNTASVARLHGAYVCEFRQNVGQGTVLRHGYRLALEHGAEIIITTDADGQWDPRAIPAMVEPVLRDEADFVIGSRRLGRTETEDAVRHLGVHVFAWLVNLLTRAKVTDTSSGLRAFKATMAVDVPLTQPQYQTSELLVGALLRGYRVTERPCVMHKRMAGKSKKGGNWIYGARYALVILGTWWRERNALQPGRSRLRWASRSAESGRAPQRR